MTDYRQQFTDIQRLLSVLLLCVAPTCLLQAGEVAIEPNDNGSDIREDTTEDIDSRSDEVAAAAETMLDVVAAHEGDVPLAEAVTSADGTPEALHILDTAIMPGESLRLSWSATELFEGVPVATPVLVVNGALPGPTLCLTAAVHGDELNGIGETGLEPFEKDATLYFRQREAAIVGRKP